MLRGNPGDVLRDITLENVVVQMADEEFSVGQIENLTLNNVVVNGRPYLLPAKP
jgi:hypothetical protein